jgi:uncharacterized membrane protein YobD (UPF0266 family)
LREHTGGSVLKIKPSHEGPIDVIVWVSIFGGLLSIVVALVLQDTQPAFSSWLGGIGGLATVLGLFLIYIRSKS